MQEHRLRTRERQGRPKWVSTTSKEVAGRDTGEENRARSHFLLDTGTQGLSTAHIPQTPGQGGSPPLPDMADLNPFPSLTEEPLLREGPITQ